MKKIVSRKTNFCYIAAAIFNSCRKEYDMMAIVQYLLMVAAAVSAVVFGFDTWLMFQAGRNTTAAFCAVIAVFFAGASILLAFSMTEEAERDFSKRQRKE